jgi:hypothetical protein
MEVNCFANEKAWGTCMCIRPVSMGFQECFMHIKCSATSEKFHFLHETMRREKERVSPWWNLWAQFHMRSKLCETPIETQIEFHHATMQLNHTMRERLWDPWAYETVQLNYALRETSISYQSFTSWKPGRWNSPLRLALVKHAEEDWRIWWPVTTGVVQATTVKR